MVESKETTSKNLQKSLGQIEKTAGSYSNIDDVTLEAVSKILIQAPDRWERPTV